MSLSAAYNTALADIRAADNTISRAIIANQFLDEAWRFGEIANKYRCVVAESTYVRNQLEKIIDRTYTASDHNYALRRSSSVVCNIDGIDALSDAELDKAIEMGAAVYTWHIKAGRFINYLNKKLAKPLTYGQAEYIIERICLGYNNFPEKPQYKPVYDVILAFMIKCGREVRRVEKRYERRSVAAPVRKIIKHDEDILKIILLSMVVFYLAAFINFMLY